MNLKKTFPVKGKLWTLEYKWRLTDDDGNPVDGLCDPANRIIYIDRLLPKEQKFSTFIHELFHATFHEAHLGEDGGIDGFAEEVVCSSATDTVLTLFNLRWKRGL